MRVTRSSAICEPTVTTTSSGSARIPSSAITSQICSRSSGRALRRAVLQRDLAVAGDELGDHRRPSASSGSAARLGMPPASETTSGRLATANSARISDAVMPAVRCREPLDGRAGLVDVIGRPERLPGRHESSVRLA